MALEQNDYDFGGSNLHGIVHPSQPADLPITIGRFFGVRGESHLLGRTYGRPLECEYLLSDFDDPADLKNLLVSMDLKVGELTGDLAQTGNWSQTFGDCTFIGFERGIPFFDGSGEHGWCVEGRLKWIQRTL